ncbi:hypothetical protein LFL96_28400 [Paraburkholderia sp. D15]|uniref:hypothetical protein n=1 Tax=Paraburkholderia sp. D15 TaxID=2880218 RepID=UPI00247A2DFD|nr:hypothetical protein [Paraburkholderia sp. D15]WGS52126.1 hypothetical protein LFL96_28400 [Paraburkholderia sp. D15]
MSTVSSLNASLSSNLLPALNAPGKSAALADVTSADIDAASPSTIVTIPSAVAESPIVYTPQGALLGLEPTTTWAQSNNTDAVSLAMAGNYTANTISGQFYNLGSTLLNRFKTTGSDFSQSVTLGSTGAAGAASAIGASSTPQGDARLTVKTASGVTVVIEMDSGNGTLGVSVNSSGKLSDTERSALAKLADGFQKAINGLSASPPTVDLSGLTQFDTSVLSSVNLQFNVTGSGQQDISASFSQNSSARSFSVTDSLGTMNVKVDTSNAALLGSGAQHDQAIASYLAQFDNASARGHGNAQLMSMFKDAFTQLNSNEGTPTQQLPGTAYAPWLAQSDQSMLTGLADFSASITDTPVSSNPYRLSEQDTFSYQVSQTTSTQGNQFDSRISQMQQSHLQASYHLALSGGGAPTLDATLASQNYDYMRIDDSASSAVNIATKQGKLLAATLDQSSSQSTRQSEYVKGVLTSDVTTPTETSNSKDLLALLKPFLENDQAAQNSDGWQNALSSIHGMIFLNANAA